MKKEYKVEGMACGHCRKSVENALNSIDGVKATVTLEPPVARVEFTGGEIPMEELQRVISESGEYMLVE